jgi:hypothetical protein
VIQSNLKQKKKTLLFETDWLASTPVFYNSKNNLASKKIYDVLPKDFNLNFHPEGLSNFLDFGYSVFGQTPVENVNFLPPSSRLFHCDEGNLFIEQINDPTDKWIDYTLSEVDIIDLIKERVQNWEKSLPSNQEIILPLSGGFDSRLLLWCLKDKSRIRAYTYGLSSKQDKSIEIVHAKKLAKHFKLNWQQIFLGNFHQYFNDWDNEFGFSVHAHGMYHLEFYNKIRENLKEECALLSGIVGDAWAGTVSPTEINNEKDLVNLSFSHGMCANSKFLKLPRKSQIKKKFFIDNREKLSGNFQVITTIRLKIILLSYLMSVPKLFKFKPWTPYLDIDIAMAMLNLPKKRRLNRQWQVDFFKKVGLGLENQNFKSDRKNNLNIQALKKQKVAPLNTKLLSQLFEKKYIEWINKNAFVTPWREFRSDLLDMPKIGGVLRSLGIKNTILESYFAYLCLKPIEKILKNKK